MLESLSRALDKISRWAVWAGGAMLIASSFLVAIDVVLRKTIGRTLAGSDEISGYIFGIATTWAFAFVLTQRFNVRIDSIYQVFPGSVRATIDILNLVLLGTFAGVLTWRASLVFWSSLTQGSHAATPLRTPLAIPQGLWLLGLILFSIVIVVLLVRCLDAVLRRDVQRVHEIAGPMAATEEVEGEIATLRRPEAG